MRTTDQDPRRPTAAPRAIVAELRRPQVFLGVAIWSGLVALLLVLSAQA
jgi:hypothetical protein